MAVRSLDQIVGELQGVYQPQIQSIQQQKALIPQGVEADISEAKAAQSQSFDDIMSSARRRGIGYSGLPIGEQQKYSSTVFAPEILRARQRGKQQELSLTDALNSIYENRRKYADTLRQGDIANDQWNQTFAFEKEKWAQSLRDQAEARAAASRAAAASYGGGYVGAGGQQAAGAPKSNIKVNPRDQELFNRMFLKPGGGAWDANSLISDYNATLRSAQFGNMADKKKIEMYHAARPDLFGSNVPAATFRNGGGLRF